MVTGTRALRIAVAANEQVAQNPQLRAAQARAWRKFIRHVWGGPVCITVPSRCCDVDDRDPLGACRCCGRAQDRQ
jgi:hypothetical protein